MAERETDFYIGYEPRAPRRLARRMRAVVLLLLGLAAAVAVTLALAQGPFAVAAFEYGVERSFEGVIQLEPYPRLLVERSGKAGTRSSYLLVAPGKRGAGPLVGGLEGRKVRLRGTLIYRQDQTMVEVVPGSVAAVEGAAGPESSARTLGRHTLTGEIVDSKCFLGVMKPGFGKAHRACASLCIRGGIPPILVLREPGSEAPAAYLLLVGVDGRPLNKEVLDFVGEWVEVEGEVLEQDGVRSLRVEPKDIRRRS